MNGVFFTVSVLSIAILAATCPDIALTAMLSGGRKACELSVTMLAVYALWLGVLKVAEDSGITSALARLLKRPVRLIFGKVSDRACEHISINLSANLLGMGGVATPMGIRAAEQLDRDGNYYASCMLFVLASTSIQLLPTSVIALRAEAGSASPGDVILPSLIATTFSTALACACVHLLCKGKRR